MYECGYCHPMGNGSITPWAEKISSAQMENIKKNFASVKPMNEKPIEILKDASVSEVKDTSVATLTRSESISVIHHKSAQSPNILNTEFFLKRLEEMTRTQGKFLIWRQRILSARA